MCVCVSLVWKIQHSNFCSFPVIFIELVLCNSDSSDDIVTTLRTGQPKILCSIPCTGTGLFPSPERSDRPCTKQPLNQLLPLFLCPQGEPTTNLRLETRLRTNGASHPVHIRPLGSAYTLTCTGVNIWEIKRHGECSDTLSNVMLNNELFDGQ